MDRHVASLLLMNTLRLSLRRSLSDCGNPRCTPRWIATVASLLRNDKRRKVHCFFHPTARVGPGSRDDKSECEYPVTMLFSFSVYSACSVGKLLP
jgi:hypothetical protein